MFPHTPNLKKHTVRLDKEQIIAPWPKCRSTVKKSVFPLKAQALGPEPREGRASVHHARKLVSKPQDW